MLLAAGKKVAWGTAPVLFLRLACGCARACEGIFTIGFYTHCSRFMSRLFLRPLKAKEYDRAAAKQPVDFIACVRFLLRLPHAQTNHLMHYSMLHLLSEKSQIIPFRVIIKFYQKVMEEESQIYLRCKRARELKISLI